MHELSGKNGSLTAAANSKLAKQHRARGKPYRPPTMKADACPTPWDGCPMALDGNPPARDGCPRVRDSSPLPRNGCPPSGRMYFRNRNSVDGGIEAMSTRSIVTSALLVLALICFFYIWPGVSRYRYENHAYRSRVDRLTGQVQEWREADRVYGLPSEYVMARRTHWHGKEPCPLCKPWKSPPLPHMSLELPRPSRKLPVVQPPSTYIPTVSPPDSYTSEYQKAKRDMEEFRESLGPMPTSPFEPVGK